MFFFKAIGNDPDWVFLITSESYVCYDGIYFCGFIRAIVDEGMALYISELFVLPEYRSQSIGQKLIEKIKDISGSLTVYSLSDEDKYYTKKGYKNIGSVFEI